MNHDSSHAPGEEVSATPWETIDAEEPVAGGAERGTDCTKESSAQNSSAGAAPVVLSEARAAVITDPFDPGDEALAEIVPPVSSPAESTGQENSVLIAETLLLESTEPPVGTPAALTTESPVAQKIGISSRSEVPVGSSLRTDSFVSEEEVRNADPTSSTPDHGQEYLPMPPQAEAELQSVGSAPRTIVSTLDETSGIAEGVAPANEMVRRADPTSVISSTDQFSGIDESVVPADESVRMADPTAAQFAPTGSAPNPAIDDDVAEEAAVPAVIEAKSFFAQSIVDSDVPSDEDEADEPIVEPEPVWEDPEMADAPAPQLTGASWTIPLLCAGIGLIACCIVIPQSDANRRLAYEKMTLQADLESVQKQVAVNDAFLKKVVDDPSLAERLAQRQLKRVRKGQRVLRLNEEKPQMSPFQITNVAPPPAPPPYKPIGGILASLCYDARTRLYLMGVSMAMIACGLVMGATPGRR